MITQSLQILNRWGKGEVPPPEEVQLYPTNVCNLKCIFCVTTTGIYRGQKDVPKRRWLAVAQELCDLGVRRVLISGGGEPLLSPATLPMMRLFKENGVYGRMITNGTVWTGDAIKAAVEIGWDQVTFSIDGPNPAIHEGLRVIPGCFERATSAIHTFREIKNCLGRAIPRLEINCVLSRANYTRVCEMVELAVNLGIAHLNLEPVCNNNPQVERIKLRKQERKELQDSILPNALRIAESHDLSTNIRNLRDIGNLERAGEMRGFIIDQLAPRVRHNPFLELACYEPWLWPKIEANGEVWPCSTTPSKENIRDKDFIDIWNGEVFRDYRRRIIERDLPDSCQNCVVSHLHTNQQLRAGIRAGGVI